MFFKLFALFAMVAVAFASPKPEPQLISYTAGAYPAAYPYYAGGVYSPYTAGALPYAYNGYFIR